MKNVYTLAFLALFLIVLSAQILSADLVHRWDFEDGTANDLIGTMNLNLWNCSISSGQLHTSSGSSNAYNDNAEGYSPEDWTLVTWVTTSDTGSNRTITTLRDSGSWNNYIIVKSDYSSGNVILEVGKPQVIYQAAYGSHGLSDGQPHHVAVTWDWNAGTGQAAIHLYLDGSPHVSGTYNVQLSNWPNVQFKIGGNKAPSGDYEEYDIYNTALSAAEVTTLYNTIPPTPPSNLIASIAGDCAQLDWDDNPPVENIVSYKIYRSQNPHGTFSLIDTTSNSDYLDNAAPLEDCKNYYYKVSAVNNNGTESGLSPVASIVVPCEGDVNGDHIVNIEDLSLIALYWIHDYPAADFDSSGTIDNKDFRNLSAGWKKQRPEYGQPNIVWIMGEDCGKQHYDLFDPVHGTSTPNIDTLAQEGLIFNNAYCNVAVCSAARSTLITGCYPSRIGVQWHRKIQTVSLPSGLQAFPAYLRQAGYYTTNSTKTDYNCSVSGVWDKSNAGEFGWRSRPTSETPFFHCRTYTVTHESSLFSIGTPTTDPASIVVPPHHPDTTMFRKTYATYHDKIHTLDNSVGNIINALNSDGLLEDTFIFFFGDNGGTLPGSKGYITDVGLHVPLVVRVPENWKHLAPDPVDGRIDGFVNFADFGATALHLAGIDIPAQMDGVPFLGQGVILEEINANDEAFNSTDRFDELYNLCRSFRKGNFKYVRNYEPFYPYSLRNNYRMRMQVFQDWRDMFNADTLNAIQSRFFEPRKGEELYDIAADPYETNNLADNPAYAATLTDLRNRLYQRITGMPDLGIMPEAVFLSEGGASDPVGYGQIHQARITRYTDIADLMLQPYINVSTELAAHLTSTDPMDRYWALTTCAAFGTEASALETTVKTMVESHPLVLSRAAVFLAEMDSSVNVENVMRDALSNCSTNPETLRVLNDIVHLKDNLGYGFSGFSSADVLNPGASLVSNRISYLGW